jgi:hypothetical protein
MKRPFFKAIGLKKYVENQKMTFLKKMTKISQIFIFGMIHCKF